MSDTEHKVLENRLRRAAERQDLRLLKSRARDPRSRLYGTYMLVDAATDFVVFADHSTGFPGDSDAHGRSAAARQLIELARHQIAARASECTDRDLIRRAAQRQRDLLAGCLL
ncbi:MAG: hypothetical protein SV966_01320 [Actinomycetota bacterium]|nr:hypothetical protein [Actinomycetota bacterium]